MARGHALSSEKNRFVFNKALSADTNKVLDPDRQQLPRMLQVVDAEGHEALRTRLEDQPLDPGKLQQIEANLSLRHRLVLAQPRLKHDHRLRPPVQLVGSEMEEIHLVIAKAFQERTTEVVEPGQDFKLADTEGHFWEPQDFEDLPSAMRVVLDETLRGAGDCSCTRAPIFFRRQIVGGRGSTVGCEFRSGRSLGERQRLAVQVYPPRFARKSYSSVYRNLETLILVCVEILCLLKLGKAMPWKRMPWILSPTAIVVKASPFEDNSMKKRIVYDCTASGVNPNLAEHQEMSLQSILRLLQSMSKDDFMAKSD